MRRDLIAPVGLGVRALRKNAGVDSIFTAGRQLGYLGTKACSAAETTGLK